MEKFNFLNSVLKNKESKVNLNRIIIKNPDTLFNSVKRGLSLFLGFLFFLLLYELFEQSFTIDSFEKISTTIMGLFVMLVLIYYAIFRSKIHKLCFVQFDDRKVFGRLPAPLSTYNYERALVFRLMITPEFEEFDFSYEEIQDIIIGINWVEIKSTKKLDQKIYLSNMDYHLLKSIKSRFDRLRNELNIAKT